MSWISFLDRIVERNPNKIAIVEQDTSRRLSYVQLQEEVFLWTNFLLENNVKYGECVAILATNRLEHLTIFLACAKIGAIFVPLNFRLSQAELDEIIERINPKVFLGVGSSKFRKDLNYHDLSQIKLEKVCTLPYINVKETDPLLMLFTSGSTGMPKGVLLSGKMLRTNQEATCLNWGLCPDDICLVETPFFHTGGYNVLCLPLLSIGGTVVLAPKFDLDNVFKTIEKERLTVYFAVPTMFQMISEDKRFNEVDFSSLRFLISGGAACPEELIINYQKKNIMFKQGFGLTEVGPNCFLLGEQDALRKIGSIGKPMPHSMVKVVDDEGNEVGENMVGELLIKGDHICAGYYKDESRFNDSLADGYFKTGDLAKYDNEGYFYITGRKKDMYISGGENVYPAEVENKLISHPDINDAIVVSIEDEKWGEIGIACLRTDRKIKLCELREYLNPILSRYKHPHHIIYTDSFPLLASGKVDKSMMKELCLGNLKEMEAQGDARII